LKSGLNGFALKVLRVKVLVESKTCFDSFMYSKPDSQASLLNPPFHKPKRARGSIARLKALHYV